MENQQMNANQPTGPAVQAGPNNQHTIYQQYYHQPTIQANTQVGAYQFWNPHLYQPTSYIAPGFVGGHFGHSILVQPMQFNGYQVVNSNWNQGYHQTGNQSAFQLINVGGQQPMHFSGPPQNPQQTSWRFGNLAYQLIGNPVIQQVGSIAYQSSGNSVSQPTGNAVSQPSINSVSQPSGNPVSQSSGNPVSQSSGYPVSQQTGNPVSQSSGNPVSQSSGNPVSQSSGNPVSQQTGNPVSEPSENSGSELAENLRTEIARNSGLDLAENLGTEQTENFGSKQTGNFGCEQTGNTDFRPTRYNAQQLLLPDVFQNHQLSHQRGPKIVRTYLEKQAAPICLPSISEDTHSHYSHNDPQICGSDNQHLLQKTLNLEGKFVSTPICIGDEETQGASLKPAEPVFTDSRKFEIDTNESIDSRCQQMVTEDSKEGLSADKEERKNGSQEVIQPKASCTFAISQNMQLAEMHQLAPIDQSDPEEPQYKANLKADTKKRAKPFACSICGYCMTNKTHLESHLKAHKAKTKHRCSKCLFITENKRCLERHIRNQHDGEKEYSCNICSYTTSHKKHLDNHVNLHSLKINFSCNHCDYKIMDRWKMTQHVLSHDNVTPDIVESSYTHISPLNEQQMQTFPQAIIQADNETNLQDSTKNIPPPEKLHSVGIHKSTSPSPILTIKPNQEPSNKNMSAATLLDATRILSRAYAYMCPKCEYRLVSKRQLDAHIRAHSAKPAYSCNQCRFISQHKKSWLNHIKTHDKIE